MSGRFITLEGGEGVGKTTNRQFIEAWLGARGIPVVATDLPMYRELTCPEGVPGCFLSAPDDEAALAAAIMLGITERHLPASQQNGFPDRVAKLVADLRADLETPDLPIVHTDYEVESTGEFRMHGVRIDPGFLSEYSVELTGITVLYQ